MKQPERMQRFIEEYLADGNATQAAIRAGYSAKTASAQASRLLTKVKVQEIIAQRKGKLAEACAITREELVGSTRDVIARCRVTGKGFRPREILLANRFLADMAGFIVNRTQVEKDGEARALDFGNLPIPHQPGTAGKPN